MSEQFRFIRRIFLNLIGLIVLFFISRLIFFVVNHEYLEIISVSEYLYLSFWGIRFDISSIFYCNFLYIFLMLIPMKIRFTPIFQKVLFFLFYFVNLLAISLELIDSFYFKFNLRRIIASDFMLFKNAFIHTYSILFEYSYILILYIFIAFALWKLLKIFNSKIVPFKLNYYYQFPIFIVGIFLLIIGSRGGFQLRPISPILANKYTSKPINSSFISNGLQSLFLTVQQRSISTKQYHSNKKNSSLFSKFHKGENDTLKPYNIVIIAMEGIGKEYIGYFNKSKTHTPFIDKLLTDNLSFDNAYANGLRSTQGILSITTGLPNLMEDPYMFSTYQNNELKGLPSYLNDIGYNTSFYHGAYEGSMNFNQFTKAIGFDSYHDMVSYTNLEDFDGTWGIWDDKYLQYVSKELDIKKEPFMSMIFSLTSHHPYNVEKWFEEKYPLLNPTIRAAKYLDYSLEHFFESIRHKKWYGNTIFVLCSDHIGLTFSDKYRTKVTKYGIPIIYMGKMFDHKNIVSNFSSHIDIMPSILDIINFPNDYYSYGTSSFTNDSLEQFTYMFERGEFQILTNKFIYKFREGNKGNLYNYILDPEMKNDISIKNAKITEKLDNRLKSVIQRYYNDMIFNRLSR